MSITFFPIFENMKKLLFTLALLITTNIYSQSINKTNDGYTEVVEVELTKQQIHQKLNEWIAFSYKSANDVVQLNTEDKIILAKARVRTR